MENKIHAPKPREICVTLIREELVYDIEFEAWKTSKKHIDNPTLQSEVHVTFEADDWIERQIETAVDRIFEKLSSSTRDSSDMVTDRLDETPIYNFDNIPRNNPDVSTLVTKPNAYFIPMVLDPAWRGSARAIRSLLHKAVTSYVLYQWFCLVMPEVAPRYLAESDDALKRADSASRVSTLNVQFRL